MVCSLQHWFLLIPSFASFSFVKTWKMFSQFLHFLHFLPTLLIYSPCGLPFSFSQCCVCAYVYMSGAFRVNWEISKQWTGGSHTKLVKYNLLENRVDVRSRLGELKHTHAIYFCRNKIFLRNHSFLPFHFHFGFCHLLSFSLEASKVICECKEVFNILQASS